MQSAMNLCVVNKILHRWKNFIPITIGGDVFLLDSIDKFVLLLQTQREFYEIYAGFTDFVILYTDGGACGG